MADPSKRMAVADVAAGVWGTADVAVGTEQQLALGDLTVVLRREPEELWIRHFYSEDTEPDQDSWTRWAASPDERYELRPALPNRSIVVSPEHPFVLGPRARSRIFVRVPLFARLFRADAEGGTAEISELPSVVLSDTWWGDFVDGELAYWVRTRARRVVSPEVFQSHLAICAFALENQSAEALTVDRFAVRVAYLTLFGRDREIWTDEVQVRYEGAEEGSEIHYSGRIAKEASDVELIAEPRQPPPRGLHARTFSRLRALGGA